MANGRLLNPLAMPMKAASEGRNFFAFQIKLGGALHEAKLRFASQTELRRYHRSLAIPTRKSSKAIRDAVEFTRLAAKRWRYYAEAGEAAESLAALRRAIHRDERCEVAFILIATARQSGRDVPLGLAYCRRTWCHHLALDFLALHPRTLDERGQVAGVGSGIVFGLVQLAEVLRVARIWGEATAHSAPFYERLLALRPILDLFTIEAREMAAIRSRQATVGQRTLATRVAP